MKKNKYVKLQHAALAAVGVFLGRGAQADTILDFDLVPAGQPNNDVPGVEQWFGDTAAVSTEGVTVTGFGTPNIDLSWKATGGGEARWDYYNDAGVYDVWSAAQLNDSAVGARHSLTFAPNSASARVVVKSFNFHPYYNTTERFTYDVSVFAGGTVVSGPTRISFLSDASKNHAVAINATGAPGQALRLELARVASTLGQDETEGGAFNIAVDDIRFAQMPEAMLPAGPQVVSVTPDDGQTGVRGLYSYAASITNGGSTLLVPSSIQLNHDGTPVSPPPVISSSGGLTNVNFQAPGFLASGSVHTYTLSYTDSGEPPATYSHEIRYTVANYATLPAAYAVPIEAGVTRGFTARSARSETGGNTLDYTLARAEAQLNGTLIDPLTSEPYPNFATPGPNPDGSYNLDTVLNFDDNQDPASGNFTGDVLFPGLPEGFNNWFSTEAWLHVELQPGYYEFGVNSDDGFGVSAVPPPGRSGSPIVLGSFDGGRGASDTLFDFLVQTPGIYPLRLVYFEGTGNASCELFSVNLATEQKLLINDPAQSSAIKSYRVLKPHLTSIVRNGQDVVLQWAYGKPPFQVRAKTDLTKPGWTDVGAPTENRTATVQIQPGASFLQVAGQP